MVPVATLVVFLASALQRPPLLLPPAPRPVALGTGASRRVRCSVSEPAVSESDAGWPYGSMIEEQTQTVLASLRESALEALARQRHELSLRVNRPLLLAAAMPLLWLLMPRHGLGWRAAYAIFTVTRFACASIHKRPGIDPLVPVTSEEAQVQFRRLVALGYKLASYLYVSAVLSIGVSLATLDLAVHAAAATAIHGRTALARASARAAAVGAAAGAAARGSTTAVGAATNLSAEAALGAWPWWCLEWVPWTGTENQTRNATLGVAVRDAIVDGATTVAPHHQSTTTRDSARAARAAVRARLAKPAVSLAAIHLVLTLAIAAWILETLFVLELWALQRLQQWGARLFTYLKEETPASLTPLPPRCLTPYPHSSHPSSPFINYYLFLGYVESP